MPSPLFVIEMEKVVMICDRLDQTMVGVQYVFENDTKESLRGYARDRLEAREEVYRRC